MTSPKSNQAAAAPPKADDAQANDSKRPVWPLAAGLGLAAVASSIWLTLRPPDLPDSGLDFRPTAEQSLKIDQLRAQISKAHPKFRDTDARAKDNAKLFTYMAATSEDPLVLEAALTAIQASYSSRSEKKETPDRDLDRVLVRYMQSPSAPLAELAFQAARIPLMTEEPQPELISALATIVESDGPLSRRYRALETLNLLRPSLRNETARATFEKTLTQAEPLLVSLSLYALTESGPSFEKAEPNELKSLGQRALALLKHEDPGVRGRALALLTSIPTLTDLETLIGVALAALRDKSGYVRGQATDTLAQRAGPSAISEILPLTRDLSRARYDISGWTDLSGEPGVFPHDIPGRKTVAETALFAIRSIRGKAVSSGALPAEPELKISLGPALSDELILENARLVELWVREMPTLSALAPVHHTQKSAAEPSAHQNPAE